MPKKGLEQAATATGWWLPRTVPVGKTLDCRLGPLALQIHRTRNEWHVSLDYGDEVECDGDACLQLRDGAIEAEEYERFMFAGGDARLALTPLLADRPVVIRPRQPIFLPSGEETTMYLSSPLFLRLTAALRAGDPGVVLREAPMLRLSDTWFGPSTREGELCYSGRTTARQRLEEIPKRAHRAITPLHIRNEAPSPLPLERVSLPVPLLSLYGAVDGSLWTQRAVMTRRSDTDMAALKIDKAPAEYAGRVTLVSGPRHAQVKGGVVRAFNMLFGDRP